MGEPEGKQRQEFLSRLRSELGALAAEVDDVRRSESFNQFLEAMSHFWHYSPFNMWLIRMQRPGAQFVAGKRVWAKLGRTVVEGAEEIAIWAPTSPGRFVLVGVFDLSQTTGKPFGLDTVLEGSTDKVALLEQAAAKLGVRVVELKGHRGVVGLSVGGEIRIHAGVSQMERAATISHELAHELLHQSTEGRKRALTHEEEETEAEATSYLVMRVLGLPSKAPAYLAWKGARGTMVLAACGRVQRAARQILEAAGLEGGGGVSGG